MIIRPTPHKCEIFGGLGLRWHKRTYLFRYAILAGGCTSPQSSFDHSRCFDDDTSADGAADLLEVLRNSPLEKLNFGACSQIPSAAWQKLRGASWTNLRQADFGWCLVLQTSLRCLASSLRRCVFFQMWRAIVTGVSLTTFDNIERPKMWNRQLHIIGLAKVTCKRSGNRLPSFYRDSPAKMACLCRPRTLHIVIFNRLPKPPRCAIYAELHKQHRHWKSCQESRTCHLVGYSGGAPPLMVHLPLKWRDEDPVSFERCIRSFWAIAWMKKRIINLFYWFACP